MTSNDNSSFVNLKPENYPFTVRFVSIETGEVLDEIYVDGPGAIMVKPYGPNMVNVEIHWPDGVVEKA